MQDIKDQFADCDNKEEGFIPFPVWSPQHSPCNRKKEFHPVHFKIPGSKANQKPLQSEGNLSRFLAASDSQKYNIEIHKRPEPLTKIDLDEKKNKYIKLQSGGDVPLFGFRAATPEIQGSSKKYRESNINIHYDTPVLFEEKDYIPEKCLVDQQASYMIKKNEEIRKNKLLKEKVENENRRHTDNFTPSQKTPIQLNRYDDENLSSVITYKVAKAIHDFKGFNHNELSFKKGDIVMLFKKVDNNWYDGQICGKKGLIPSNYVEILSKPKRENTGISAVAKFNFKAESKVELDFNKGDIILILRRIDQNWFEGQIDNRKGIFPCSYVYVLNEDELYNSGNTENLIKINERKIQKVEKFKDNQYKVIYPYKPNNADELELKEGDIVQVYETCDDGWFIGSIGTNFGTFPGNYVDKL